MKKLTALLLAIGFTTISFSYAQTGSLKGTVVDSTNKVNLHNAVVSLLRPKDSVLVKFVRTNPQGSFEISNLPAGKFIVMISYPDYADFVDDIDLTTTPQKSMGNVYIYWKR
jgi:hypothetical protein